MKKVLDTFILKLQLLLEVKERLKSEHWNFTAGFFKNQPAEFVNKLRESTVLEADSNFRSVRKQYNFVRGEMENAEKRGSFIDRKVTQLFEDLKLKLKDIEEQIKALDTPIEPPDLDTLLTIARDPQTVLNRLPQDIVREIETKFTRR